MTTAKILVVDDEPNIRLYLERVLIRDGHEVVPADSVEAAREALCRAEFDLALIDLRLKGASGMELLRHLRQVAPDTSAIVLTGYASLETAVEALREGAHDYLFKPAKTVELRESVRTGLLKRERELRRRLLLKELERNLSSTLEEIRSSALPEMETEPTAGSGAHHETSHGRFLNRGDFIVDFTRHVITLQGELLELSPTEFDLLAYMISEAPRVISPQELVREVQGYESEPWEASDTVRYHIYRLRGKIREAVGSQEIIRTVRGVGYTLGEI